MRANYNRTQPINRGLSSQLDLGSHATAADQLKFLDPLNFLIGSLSRDM